MSPSRLQAGALGFLVLPDRQGQIPAAVGKEEARAAAVCRDGAANDCAVPRYRAPPSQPWLSEGCSAGLGPLTGSSGGRHSTAWWQLCWLPRVGVGARQHPLGAAAPAARSRLVFDSSGSAALHGAGGSPKARGNDVELCSRQLMMAVLLGGEG